MLTQPTLSGGAYKYLQQSEYDDSSYVGIVGGSAVVIDPAFFRNTADAMLGYAAQISKPGMEVYGGSYNVVRGTDIAGTLLDGSTDRIARVADPDDAAKRCWRMRCGKADPDTLDANSRRAEFSYVNVDIEYGEVVTCGFKYRLPSYAGHTDEFVFAQLHAGELSTLTNPWCAFYFKNNQPTLTVKFANSTVLATPITHTPNQWVKAVIVTKWHSTAGFVRCYIDGVLVVNYSGPVAENEYSGAAYYSYWKSGIYEWDALVQWDNAFPVREVYIKGLYVSSGDVSEAMSSMLDLI